MFGNLQLAVIYGGISSEHDASLKGFDFIYDSGLMEKIGS